MLHCIGQWTKMMSNLSRRLQSNVGHHIQSMLNVLGGHTMWMFNFYLRRKMPINVSGVEQAVRALWCGDIFFSRPGESSL